MSNLKMYEQMIDQHRIDIDEEDWDDTTIAIMLGIYDEWSVATYDEDCDGKCDDDGGGLRGHDLISN